MVLYATLPWSNREPFPFLRSRPFVSDDYFSYRMGDKTNDYIKLETDAPPSTAKFTFFFPFSSHREKLIVASAIRQFIEHVKFGQNSDT